MGGSLAGGLCRALHLNDKDERILTMCGMAGGFSALFGTPLAAAVFAMEVESIGVMYYAALVPCVTSALTAQFVADLFGATPTAYAVTGVPAMAPLAFLQVAALGVLCAILANLFCQAMSGAGNLYRRFFPNRYLRVAMGGAIVVLLTLLEGSGDYNGAGGAVIAAAVAGTAVPYAFLMKPVFTALTLGAGFKGGEIVPVLFTGATFGCVAAPLLGLSASFGAAVGMTAVFCGVTNSPMTSILLGFELFGGAGVPLLALACAVSYMLSGYSGLYREQKIMYSKTGPTFINLKSGAHAQADEDTPPKE